MWKKIRQDWTGSPKDLRYKQKTKKAPAGTQPELKFWWCTDDAADEIVLSVCRRMGNRPCFYVLQCGKTDRTPLSKKNKEKALKPSGFKAFPVAGAEGFEPSARGFGDRCSTTWAMPLKIKYPHIISVLARFVNIKNNIFWFFAKTVCYIVQESRPDASSFSGLPERLPKVY